MSRFVEQNPTDNTMVLLTMLSNPEELKAKLAELRAQEKALDEKIALAGKADEILVLREAAQALQEEARETMEKTKLEAKIYLDNAKVEAEQAVYQANRVLAEARESAKRQEAELKQYETDFKNKLEKDRLSFMLDCQDQTEKIEGLRHDAETFNRSVMQKNEELTQIEARLAEKESKLDAREKTIARAQRDANGWYNDLKTISDNFAKELSKFAR